VSGLISRAVYTGAERWRECRVSMRGRSLEGTHYRDERVVASDCYELSIVRKGGVTDRGPDVPSQLVRTLSTCPNRY
jgi:hypothetical protein